MNRISAASRFIFPILISLLLPSCISFTNESGEVIGDTPIPFGLTAIGSSRVVLTGLKNTSRADISNIKVFLKSEEPICNPEPVAVVEGESKPTSGACYLPDHQPGWFHLSGECTQLESLGAGESCALEVQVEPYLVGLMEDKLVVTYSVGQSIMRKERALSAEGFLPEPRLTLSVNGVPDIEKGEFLYGTPISLAWAGENVSECFAQSNLPEFQGAISTTGSRTFIAQTSGGMTLFCRSNGFGPYPSQMLSKSFVFNVVVPAVTPTPSPIPSPYPSPVPPVVNPTPSPIPSPYPSPVPRSVTHSQLLINSDARPEYLIQDGRVIPGYILVASNIFGGITPWAGNIPFLDCRKGYSPEQTAKGLYIPLIAFKDAFNQIIGKEYTLAELELGVLIPQGAVRVEGRYGDMDYASNSGQCNFTLTQKPNCAP